MKHTKRILSIEVKQDYDSDPDTSWLGEYSDRKTSEYSLDRAHDEDCPNFDNEDGEEESCTCGFDGYWNNREYRYFNPSSNYVDKAGHALEGNTPEDVRKYTKQDYDRLESLHRGAWAYIGIWAQADIVIGTVRQTIRSGGLWGIEDDSEPAYFKEVEHEELSELRNQLHALGFSKRAIAEAIKGK